MYIVWGSKLMGKCDVVPGLFHVATKFGHIYYLPLIPTGTWVVLGESGKTFRGVQISLSFKSIMLAWLRGFFLVAGVIFGLMALIEGMDKHQGPWLLLAFVGAAMWTIGGVLCWAPFCTRASFARACALAKELGLSAEGYDMIGKIYGQAPPRGFEVKKAVAPAAAAPPATVAQPTMSRPQPIDDGGAIPLEPPAPPVARKRPAQSPGQIGLS